MACAAGTRQLLQAVKHFSHLRAQVSESFSCPMQHICIDSLHPPPSTLHHPVLHPSFDPQRQFRMALGFCVRSSARRGGQFIATHASRNAQLACVNMSCRKRPSCGSTSPQLLCSSGRMLRAPRAQAASACPPPPRWPVLYSTAAAASSWLVQMCSSAVSVPWLHMAATAMMLPHRA